MYYDISIDFSLDQGHFTL